MSIYQIMSLLAIGAFPVTLFFEARKIMSALESLRAEVARTTSVAESAITLITGLKTALDAAITSPTSEADLLALSASLGEETSKLAAAVSANTPMPVPASQATSNTSTPAQADLPPDHPLAIPPTPAVP